MATIYTRQAQGEIGPVFSSQQKSLSQQVPATQELYGTLLASLQAQAGAGTQNVVESAQRRGVDRARLGQDVGASLDEAVNLGGAQLGAQEAENIANIRGNQAQLGLGRAEAVSSLASTRQEQALEIQRNKLQKRIQTAEFRQGIKEAEREFQLTKRRGEISAAKSASSGGASEPGEEISDQIQGELITLRGSDGHVSPKDYNRTLGIWYRNGGDPAAFHTKFIWAVNLDHAEDYYKPEIGQAKEAVGAFIRAGKRKTAGIILDALKSAGR